jgi:hypothetical protein
MYAARSGCHELVSLICEKDAREAGKTDFAGTGRNKKTLQCVA